VGARVDLHLRTPSGGTLATAALLNGGFEAAEPHVLLPRRAFAHLYVHEPAGVATSEVQTAGGPSDVLVVPDPIDAWVDGGDRSGPVAAVRILVSDAETEALVSDTAIDALGLEIKSHGRGIWRFAGEDHDRQSVPPQLW